MTFLLALLVLSVVLSIETVRRIVLDDRGPQRPPASHADDPRFRAPSLR